jgi:hypothetical protein
MATGHPTFPASNEGLKSEVGAKESLASRNENFVLVRSKEPEARSQNCCIGRTAAFQRTGTAPPFWLLASGF